MVCHCLMFLCWLASCFCAGFLSLINLYCSCVVGSVRRLCVAFSGRIVIAIAIAIKCSTPFVSVPFSLRVVCCFNHA